MRLYKTILLISALATQLAAEIDWVYSLQSAKDRSYETKKPIMIFAATKSCPYCVMMKDVVLTDEKISSYISNNFVAFLLYPRAGEYPKNANIKGVPTLLFYDVNENKISQNIEGLLDPSELMNKLKAIKK